MLQPFFCAIRYLHSSLQFGTIKFDLPTGDKPAAVVMGDDTMQLEAFPETHPASLKIVNKQ